MRQVLKLSATHKLITITFEAVRRLENLQNALIRRKFPQRQMMITTTWMLKKITCSVELGFPFEQFFTHSFSVGPAVIDGTCNEETFIRNSFVFPRLFPSTGDLKIQ